MYICTYIHIHVFTSMVTNQMHAYPIFYLFWKPKQRVYTTMPHCIAFRLAMYTND